ncbi:GNAT family N-acetyltransferase [Clavibacter nebraskensis]|uniref:GNAT family N-acetyltransferase n=1 Tax=Clavibacter nebraskensis TaxID=31963 RepID=UPI001EEDB766|nr:GNAT family N-acetyltransferase [Clavibacter nebraskensis]UKF27842.1 GNAT family N-acetyltransferase [Clavibacter nebraskensis]UQB14147.1 GNAT family N-acetyltransferase [Clavibacter nebraskensis]
MQIRPATDADWPLIHPFYRAIVDAGRTYALPAGQSLEEARPNWMAQAPARTFVAVDDDGTVLGSAKAGPNRPGRGAHVATGSFLVDPAHGGRGVGRALGEHVMGWARAEGYRAIQFNAVVETNRAAVHLWESLGFRIIGTVPAAFDHADDGLVGLHVMHLPLDEVVR